MSTRSLSMRSFYNSEESSPSPRGNKNYGSINHSSSQNRGSWFANLFHCFKKPKTAVATTSQYKLCQKQITLSLYQQNHPDENRHLKIVINNATTHKPEKIIFLCTRIFYIEKGLYVTYQTTLPPSNSIPELKYSMQQGQLASVNMDDPFVTNYLDATALTTDELERLIVNNQIPASKVYDKIEEEGNYLQET